MNREIRNSIFGLSEGGSHAGVLLSTYWLTRYISALSVTNTSDTTQTVTATIVGSGHDGVSFEYSTDSGVNWSAGITDADGILNQTGLTAGTNYTWRARLYKGTNFGSYSSTVNATPVIGLTNYYAAKANLDAGNSAIYGITFIGDSITQGQYLGTAAQIRDNCFSGLIRNYFEGKYGYCGYGAMPMYHYSGVAQFVFTGTWTAYDQGYKQTSTFTTTVNDYATVQFKGTGVSLLASGVVNASCVIDGAAPIAILTGGGSTPRITAIATGLTNTDHTLVITYTGIPGQVFNIVGIISIGGTKGFRCNNISRAGYGVWRDVVANPILWTALLVPKLTIIMTGGNEIVAGYTVNQLTGWLQTLITEGLKTGDVMLICPPSMLDRTEASQDPYYTAVIALAATNSIHCVNIYDKWKRNGVALGFMYDDRHPNAAGHADIAEEIMKCLR